MFDALFSPLGSEYCNFFLYVSIFSFYYFSIKYCLCYLFTYLLQKKY